MISCPTFIYQNMDMLYVFVRVHDAVLTVISTEKECNRGKTYRII
jgi:hypothetical protein